MSGIGSGRTGQDGVSAAIGCGLLCAVGVVGVGLVLAVVMLGVGIADLAAPVCPRGITGGVYCAAVTWAVWAVAKAWAKRASRRAKAGEEG